MVRIGECLSCQFGDHSGHVRAYDPAPEGVMGGAMCPCQGECDERGPSRFVQRQLDKVTKALRRARS